MTRQNSSTGAAFRPIVAGKPLQCWTFNHWCRVDRACVRCLQRSKNVSAESFQQSSFQRLGNVTLVSVDAQCARFSVDGLPLVVSAHAADLLRLQLGDSQRPDYALLVQPGASGSLSVAAVENGWRIVSGNTILDVDAAPLRIRGGGRTFMCLEDGELRLRSAAVGPVDAHLSADPTALMLTFLGRQGIVRAISQGRLAAWGRRPWWLPRLLAATNPP